MSKKNLDGYKEKRVTWSKGNVVCTGTIFVASVGLAFWLYISGNIQNMYDVSVIVTLISVTGAIFGSNLVWYSKKASAENQYKLRMSMYKEAAKARLEYNEQMMILKKKYEMTQEDIDNIDMTGDMDDFMDSALSDVRSKLDESQNEFESPDNLETFSL